MDTGFLDVLHDRRHERLAPVGDGIDVDLEGPGWKGEGLEVETSNGGVHLRIPEQYSAHLETGTVNGGLNIDFPVTVQGRVDREISANLGSGGAPIRVRTHNGGVKVSRK